jgi:hypothetical protein
MFNSFLLGIVGALAGFTGVVCLLLSMVGCAMSQGGGTWPIATILGLGLLFFSAYAKYLSRHTVRIRK